MKKRILIFGVLLILAGISYYLFQMYGFAKGVQGDAKKRQEFMNKKKIYGDSLLQISNDTIK